MADMIIKQQKPIKVGNSYAMTIDPAFFRAAGIKPTNNLTVRYSSDGAFMTILPTENVTDEVRHEEQVAVVQSMISPEFRDWVDKSLEDDAESLKVLANL